MMGVIGKKLGMTQIFKDDGQMVSVTVVEVLPATVMGLRTKAKNGYQAVQLVAEPIKDKHLNKAQQGQFNKVGVTAGRHIHEFRLNDLADYEIGKTIAADFLTGEKKVTVVGTSKGKGFAGTIKRHNFSRGPETHGSKNIRAPGSMGAHSFPGRVFPGKKLGGHMGDAKVTVKNLELVKVDSENNLLFICGAVPGARNGKVIVRKQNHG